MIRAGDVLIPQSQIAFVRDCGSTGIVHLVPGVLVRGSGQVMIPADDWPSVRERLAADNPPAPVRAGARVRRPDASS